MSLNLGGYATAEIQQVQQQQLNLGGYAVARVEAPQQLNIGGYAVVRVGKIPTKLTLEVRPL
ncbi:MAG: hypothetical protein DRH17_13345 [Deltaproteobacteria bacterium]|nr:MAG: hypothetical protein DRH17_13345 [Deltaproteobacteria bacterium]